MKKIIFSVLVVGLFFITVVPAHAIINWTEDRIKAVCLDVIIEAKDSGVIPSPYMAGSSQLNSGLESRVSAVENRVLAVEKLFNTLSSLISQLIGMLSKLIK